VLKSEVNPIPLKAALFEKGLCKNILRSRLTCLSGEYYEKLKRVMETLE
jgi:hypothetical protein